MIPGESSRWSSIGRLALKLAVSTALMVFLLRRIAFSELKAIVFSIDRAILLAAVSAFLISNVIGSFQWHLLLRSSGISLPFHRTFRFYFVGLFFNNFLPANIGGDAVKIYDVTKIGSSVYQVIAVTLLDRLIGIFGLCLLATIATAFLMNKDSLGMSSLYLILFIGCMLPGLGLYLFKPFSRLLRRIVRRIRPLSLDDRISSILDYLSEFKGRKMLILRLMLLSCFIQALRVSTHILVGLSLGVHLGVVVAGMFFVFIPLLSLAMIPPITINGLGVREGLGIVLFSAAGIGRADAFTMEFLTYVVSVAVSLLGLLFFLLRRGASAKASV